jgi:NAD(P)-dependent dehydrogenase (short-subunit alcohol dehydrogenase family)
MFGETLRLELLPLNINVVTVITGAIETNITKNSPAPVLHEALPYFKALEQITKLSAGVDGVKRMKREKFARKVVGDVLLGTGGKVWRGASASATRLASLLAPSWVLVSTFAV